MSLLTTPTQTAKATRVINMVYAVIVVLFLLDSLTDFEIKNQGIKTFTYFGFGVGAVLTFIWNIVAMRTFKKKIVFSAAPMVIIILIIIIGPLKLLFASAAWHTQTIRYQHVNSSIRRIESQMQSVGAFGYNTRSVEVFYLTPIFMIIDSVPDDVDNNTDWVRVDIDANELGLKGG